MHYDHPRERFCMTSTVWLSLGRCFVSFFVDVALLNTICSYTFISVVLGSPGSGCTTFLKMLANQRDTYHNVEGDVHYDSLTPKEIAAHYRGDVQYSPEDDVHFPTLTVEDTIRFAVKTRTPHSRADGQSRDELIEESTNVLITVFGLRHARKTLVGDASIHGVSGGEKKRVSISEALACRSLVNCWDKYATLSIIRRSCS